MRRNTYRNRFRLLPAVGAVVPSPASEDVIADIKAMAAAPKTISGIFKDPASYKAGSRPEAALANPINGKA
jgi:hypothetical protein